MATRVTASLELIAQAFLFSRHETREQQ